MCRVSQLLFLLVSTHYKNEFFKAASCGDAQAVRSFLEQGVDVNSRDKIGRTALMYAASYARAEVVELLLQNHANSFVKDVWGQTASTLTDHQEWGQSHQAWINNSNIIALLKIAHDKAYKKTAVMRYHK
jgi:ankyrin repeat protein